MNRKTVDEVGEAIRERVLFGLRAQHPEAGEDGVDESGMDYDAMAVDVLEALAADGPVAVLPGGKVVGMEQDGRYYCDDKDCDWFERVGQHQQPPAPYCEAHGGPLYRLADEEDGDE